MADRYSKIDFGSGTDTPTGDTVHQGFTKTNDFINGVENDLDLIDSQLNDLNISNNTHTSLIDDLGADFAILDGKVDALNISVNDDIASIESNIDTIENDLNAFNLNFNNYYTKTEIDTKIDEIESGEVDLTNYYNKTEVNGLLVNKVDNTQLANYATITQLDTKANQNTTYTKVEVDTLLNDVEVDLTGYATTDYVDSAISNIDFPTTDLTDYYNKNDVNGLLVNKVDNTQLSSYATLTYVDDAINNIDFPVTDLTNYYNKTEVNGLLINKVDNTQLANYATITQLDTKANQLTTYSKDEVDNLITNVEVDLTGYATESYVDSAIANIDFPETDLTGYATTDYVDSAIANIDIPTTDLSNYYDITEVNNLLVNKVDNTQLTDYATISQLNTKANQLTTYTKTEVDNLIDNIDFPVTDLTDYYDKTEVNSLLVNKVDNTQLADYATITQLNTKANQSTTYTKTEVDTLLSNVEVDLTDYVTEVEINNRLSFAENSIITSNNFELTDAHDNKFVLVNNDVDIVEITINATTANFIVKNIGNRNVNIIASSNNTVNVKSTGMFLNTGDITSVVVFNNDIICTGNDLDFLDNYYDRDEIDTLLNNLDIPDVDVDLSNYYTKTEVNDEFYYMHLTLQDYALKDYVDTSISTANSNINTQLSNYATLTYTDTQLNTKADKATTYTKTEVNNLIPNMNGYTTLTYTNTQLNTKADKATTYTKTEVDNLIPAGPVEYFNKTFTNYSGNYTHTYPVIDELLLNNDTIIEFDSLIYTNPADWANSSFTGSLNLYFDLIFNGNIYSPLTELRYNSGAWNISEAVPYGGSTFFDSVKIYHDRTNRTLCYEYRVWGTLNRTQTEEQINVNNSSNRYFRKLVKYTGSNIRLTGIRVASNASGSSANIPNLNIGAFKIKKY